MEEKTRVIVVMRSRYTLCIKDAVMANFRSCGGFMGEKTVIVVMRSGTPYA